MKKWELYLVVGVVVSIIGAMSLGWGLNMYFPRRVSLILVTLPLKESLSNSYRTFVGIPYQVSDEYIAALQQFLVLMVFGCSFLGLGLGIVECTAAIYNLEKKQTPTQPPTPQNH